MGTRKCPKCDAVINDDAKYCPQCGNKITNGEIIQEVGNTERATDGRESKERPSKDVEYVDKKVAKDSGHNNNIFSLILLLAAVAISVIIIAGLTNWKSPSSSTSTIDSDTIAMLDEVEPVDEGGKGQAQNHAGIKWEYSETKDEMTGKNSYFASIKSENYVEFDFPYNNELIYLTITLRKSPKYGTDVYVSIPEGQFMTVYETSISVRFDNGKIRKYKCSTPSDGSTELLFVNDAKGFINKLKASSECRISTEFYQEGSPTFVFKIKGLKWEH